MIDFTFNTSRLYTSEGQIIRATYDEEALTLRFHDFSRMIAGRFEQLSCGPQSRLDRFRLEPERFARWVMAHYDQGKYYMDHPPLSRLQQRPAVYQL